MTARHCKETPCVLLGQVATSERPFFRTLILMILAVFIIGMLYFRGREAGLLTPVSNRMRFHAIPVALSQLYHGREHDYTAYHNIALAFQSDVPIEKLLQQYSQPMEKLQGTYFWAADDRGLSDFVAGAFYLFGPNVQSLGKMYILILLVSALLYVIGYWNDIVGLAFLVFALCSIYVVSFILPLGLYSPVGTWHASVGLLESRTFEMLAFISFVHLLIYPIRSLPLTPLCLLALACQAGLFYFIYHMRSTIGWQILALGCAALMLMAKSIFQKRPTENNSRVKSLLRAGLPAVIMIAGFGIFSLYKSEMYHPIYFQELGPRTFWHNALMGFSYQPKLQRKYNIGVNDQAIVDLVIQHMVHNNDARLDSTWNSTTILNSLGGHSYFTWKTYEDVAKELYFWLWVKHPRLVLSSYCYYKPITVLRIFQHVLSPANGSDAVSDITKFKYNPFRLEILGTLLIAGWLAFRTAVGFGALLKWCVFVVPFSLIPGIAFYPSVTVLSGFIVICTLCFYVLLVLVIPFLFELRKHAHRHLARMLKDRDSRSVGLHYTGGRERGYCFLFPMQWRRRQER